MPKNVAVNVIYADLANKAYPTQEEAQIVADEDNAAAAIAQLKADEASKDAVKASDKAKALDVANNGMDDMYDNDMYIDESFIADDGMNDEVVTKEEKKN